MDWKRQMNIRRKRKAMTVIESELNFVDSVPAVSNVAEEEKPDETAPRIAKRMENIDSMIARYLAYFIIV